MDWSSCPWVSSNSSGLVWCENHRMKQHKLMVSLYGVWGNWYYFREQSFWMLQLLRKLVVWFSFESFSKLQFSERHTLTFLMLSTRSCTIVYWFFIKSSWRPISLRYPTVVERELITIICFIRLLSTVMTFFFSFSCYIRLVWQTFDLSIFPAVISQKSVECGNPAVSKHFVGWWCDF